MTPMDNPQLAALEQWLDTVVDHRFFSREELQTAYMFNLYLVNLMATSGLEYRGHSFREGCPICLLVVKCTQNQAPMVCFINGTSSINTQKSFIRMLLAGTVKWVPDRYA